jgi:hypothetical protein
MALGLQTGRGPEGGEGKGLSCLAFCTQNQSGSWNGMRLRPGSKPDPEFR